MSKKELELKRITKTASLLILSGISPNSIPKEITERVLKSQDEDGGWISIVDTIWNVKYLKLLNSPHYEINIQKGLNFLEFNRNENELWGRSKRDFSRIPVSGILFYLLPEIANDFRLYKLEKLWESEINSIVYKAGYTLMAYNCNDYVPQSKDQIEKTCIWLIKNQRKDGGFAPWLNHPIDSNVFCTSIATLGLLQYSNYVPAGIFEKAYDWLIENRLSNGIWKYHEIEDGASWGIYTLTQLEKLLN